ncbi:hypothetical protein ACWEPL_40680 [Nonomuraea sp. NPDC004186]
MVDVELGGVVDGLIVVIGQPGSARQPAAGPDLGRGDGFVEEDLGAGIVGATRNAAGIAIIGHNFACGTIKVRYARAGAAMKTVTVAQGPDEASAAWVPFTTPTDVDPRRPFLYITALNGTGRSSTNAYVIPS